MYFAITTPIMLACLLASVFIFPSWHLLAYSAALWLLYWFGITIGYHRLNAHRAFTARPWIKAALLYLGGQGHQGSPMFWGVLHNRNHHPHADTEKDILSPRHGIMHTMFTCHVKATREYAKAASARQFMDRQNIFFNEWHLPLFYFNLAALYLIGGWLLVAASINASILVYLVISFINVVGHQAHAGSYRNYDTKDQSQNNWLIGVLTLGECYHNNHHAAPRAASFSRRWWEIDVGYWLIKLIETRKTP